MRIAGARQRHLLFCSHSNSLVHSWRQRHYATVRGVAAAAGQYAGPPPCPPPPARKAVQVPGAVKKLAAFLDVDKAKSLGWAELEAVWRLRHATSPASLCAAIPCSTYERIAELARAHPSFVLPLPLSPPDLSTPPSPHQPPQPQQPRATLHYLQWAFPGPDVVTLSMTSLDEFRRRGASAHPHTTATLHLELAESNRLVLLQGEVDGIGADAARLLLMLAQRFYAADPTSVSGIRRRRLLQLFTAGSDEFDVDALVDEADLVE